MPDQNGQEKLLHTRKQTAVQLSLSIRTIDTLINAKELRVVRIGRRVLVHKDEIQRFSRRDHKTSKAESEAGNAEG